MGSRKEKTGSFAKGLDPFAVRKNIEVNIYISDFEKIDRCSLL